MALKWYKDLESWNAAVKKRKLELVGRHKAFDRNGNQLGFYKWLDFTEKRGVLASRPEELQIEPETVKMDISKITQIPCIWIMQGFESSIIKHAAYHLPTEQMYIEFKTGDRIYRYNDVPPDYWAHLTLAESLGSFFQSSKHLLVDWCYIELTKKA